MSYLLDTNICVYFLRGAYQIDEKMRAVGIENCFISEITLLELEYGVENSAPAYQLSQKVAFKKFEAIFLSRILPIRDCFSIYAKERVRLRKMGMLIGDFDLLIGCTALEKDFVLVTDNIREFSRIDGQVIENWVSRI